MVVIKVALTGGGEGGRGGGGGGEYADPHSATSHAEADLLHLEVLT